MSQSVFLNLNTNFSNDTADNYTQYFDNPIELPPNSKIALYNAEIKKSPISIRSDQNITINLTTNRKAAVVSSDEASVEDINFTISKGSYTKGGILNEIESKANEAIYINNQDITKSFLPYKMSVQNNTDSLFLGLSSDYPRQEYINVGTEVDFRYNGMDIDGASNVATGFDIFPNIPDIQLDAEHGIKCWAMSPSAVNMLMFGSETNNVENNQDSSIFFNIVDADVTNTVGTTLGCCFLKTSDIITQKTSLNNLATSVSADANVQAPLSYCGVQIYTKDLVTKLEVYGVTQTYDSADPNDDLTGENLVKLYVTEIDDPTINNRIGVSFYNTNKVNKSNFVFQDTCFKVHMMTTGSDFRTYSESDGVIFDSRDAGYKLLGPIVTDCYLNETINGNEYKSGLVPTFYCYTDGPRSFSDGDIGFANIKGNFIQDTNNLTRGTSGVQTYAFTNLGEDIKQLLGNDEILLLNPNGFNRESGPDFGVTEIYGNTTNYNIEIDTLPIKASQSTESVNNNIGTERPILFSVNNAFSGSLTAINQGELIRSIYPPQLKYISLNNVNAIKTNSLNVKIKRANDNSQAVELTSAKIEVLIN